MTPEHSKKLSQAIQYLRDRKKFIADVDCTFKPTSAAATNVRKTWKPFMLPGLVSRKGGA